MKTPIILHTSLVLFAAALSTTSQAQTVVTDRPAAVVTTTRVGRVGTITPDLLVMESASGTTPTFVRSTRTVFVDETGAPVAVETIRPGSDVTVQYTTDADHLVADRVIVRRESTVRETDKPQVIKKTTTTTTTTTPVRVHKREHDDD